MNANLPGGDIDKDDKEDGDDIRSVHKENCTAYPLVFVPVLSLADGLDEVDKDEGSDRQDDSHQTVDGV